MSYARNFKKSIRKAIMEELIKTRVGLGKDIAVVSKDTGISQTEIYTAETIHIVSWGVLLKLLDYYNKKLVIKVMDKDKPNI